MPQNSKRSRVLGWPDWADPLATERLRECLRNNHIGHAYLLAGPKGVGKADLALAFAQSICCTTVMQGDASQACGECRACRNVDRGAHPDVETFDLESQSALIDKGSSRASLSIETVRSLRSSASLLPLESSRRILIIDDAETLLHPAQQALLKTLEEPPAMVTLLLLSDEPETLLETVRSRCQQIPVRPRPEVAISSFLMERGVEATLAREVAVLSRGCPAWARAAAAEGTMLKARRAEWDAATTWIDASRYNRLVTAFTMGKRFGKKRSDVLAVVQTVVQILRARMIDAAAGAEEVAAPTGATGVKNSPLAISRSITASLQCLSDLEANVRPRLALETMVMQWPNLELQQA